MIEPRPTLTLARRTILSLPYGGHALFHSVAVSREFGAGYKVGEDFGLGVEEAAEVLLAAAQKAGQ